MKFNALKLTLLAAVTATPLLATEPGSGVYAEDCMQKAAGYVVTINSDGTANVIANGVAYENAITSYSFFGDDTPSDFLVAIMFEKDASPVPSHEGDAGWIEIWKDGEATYALINGHKSDEFDTCN